jgi:hypothetical protein
MLNRVLHKQVVLCMDNGVVLEGFVAEESDEFFNMVEMDNNDVIIRKSDISFVRLGIRGIAMERPAVQPPHDESEEQFPLEKELSRVPVAIVRRSPLVRPNEDFSMAMPSAQNPDASYRKPALIRTTER